MTEVLRDKVLTLNPVFQVAVYMGKRDFVDHCDFVDPVGEFRLSLAHSLMDNCYTLWLLASLLCVFTFLQDPNHNLNFLCL